MLENINGLRIYVFQSIHPKKTDHYMQTEPLIWMLSFCHIFLMKQEISLIRNIVFAIAQVKINK